MQYLLRSKEARPKDKLTFRPSAYAIIPQEGKVMLLISRLTSGFALPGGELILQALQTFGSSS